MGEKEAAIGDHFLIGDLHTAALVTDRGSIDWLCLPHFDSPSMFAKILDKNKGGSFSFDSSKYKSRARYSNGTAIVETTYSKGKNKFVMKDFMLPQPIKKANSHYLVRKFNSVEGTHELVFHYNPEPDYARMRPYIYKKGNTLVVEEEDGALILHMPKDSKASELDHSYRVEVKIKKGEMKEFILEYYKRVHRKYKKQNLEIKTRKYWDKWVKKGTFPSVSRERLIRSAITLKLLQYYPTGALIAAPTASLPEAIGGERNWDYRYVWIRDATFTIFAFYVLGYYDEAKRFFKYMEDIAKEREGEADASAFYTIYRRLPSRETNLDYLSGYKNSKPVRIGNNVVNQYQIDMYGALIDAYYLIVKKDFRITKIARRMILDLIEEIKNNWKKKDNGIWEIGHKPEHYTYSKVMAWVGADRALTLCDRLKIPRAKKEEIKKLADEIRKWVWDNCYDKKKGKLLQYPGSKHQDASNFLFVALKFLNKDDPITRKILENTEKELVEKKIFVRRYKLNDKFKGKEGAFILCSFWRISAWAIMGETEKADKLFHEVEKKFSKNGLMSEEINPKNCDLLGNYPQAFSHLGHIMSSHNIHKYKRLLKEEKSKVKK